MTSTTPLYRYCPACGAANPIAPGEACCFACGAALDDAGQPAAPATSKRLAPGDVLRERYRIVNQVGTGGYGAVYRARDLLDGGKEVAIKAIYLTGLKPQEAIEATDTFNREVSLLSGLSHPNLPRVYDHFTDPAHWYLVMDFIEGETLEDYVRHTTKTGQLPLTEVLEIGIQLCTVLDYLHMRQPPIIFRDVKPANIMRTKRGHLYVIDFGIARRHKPGQRKDTIALGSPGYAAPEQYGRAQTTARADIYSLGVTLHQLLTGHDPAETPFHLHARGGSAIHCCPYVPPELIALIERMTNLDADRRPESMAEVKDALQDIAAEQMRALAPPHEATSGQVYYVPPGSPISGKTSLVMATRRHRKGLIASGFMAGIVVLALIGGVFSVNWWSFHRICACEPAISQRAANQTLRIPVIGSANTFSLDPALANDEQSDAIAHLLFSGLTGEGTDGVYPRLADYWQSSPDGLTWTFHLRPDLSFSDGYPLTATGVARSLDRALQPATHSPTALADLGMIKDAQKLHSGKIRSLINDSILVRDPSTIVFRLSRPAAYFPAALASPAAFIVETNLMKQRGQSFAVNGASGPFYAMLMDAAEKGVIDLVPNDYYYGPHAQLTSIQMVFYRNTDDSFQAYLDTGNNYDGGSDQVDMTLVPLDKLLEARASANGVFRLALQPVLYYYGMNYLEKPFDNIHIREAFALALNKDLLASAIWEDTRVATNHLIQQKTPYFNPNLTGPDDQSTQGNPSQAKLSLQEGLKEEGWDSASQLPPITFTYAASSQQQLNEISAAVEMWRIVLGVTVKAHRLSGTALSRAINATVNNPRGLQMWAASWQASYLDPQQWTSLPFGQGSPFNAVNYGQNESSDSAAQQMTQQNLQQADASSSPSIRLLDYQNAEQQLVNDVAWIPMFQGEQPYLTYPYIENFTFYEPLSSYPYWSSSFIAQH